MRRLVWLVLLIPLIATGQEPNVQNAVPACTAANVATCIGGAEPGRMAWISDVAGGEGRPCIQNDARVCASVPYVRNAANDRGIVLWAAGGVTCLTVCSESGLTCVLAIDLDTTPAIASTACSTASDTQPGLLCECEGL